MKRLSFIHVLLVFVLSSCSLPTAKGNIDSQMVGTWKYEFNGGVAGQTLANLNLKEDGTFEHVAAVVMSADSGIYTSDYAHAGSYKGKFKMTGTNKILFYDILKGECEEKTNPTSIEEIINKARIENIPVADKEYRYKLNTTTAVGTVNFEPAGNPDAVDLALLQPAFTFHR